MQKHSKLNLADHFFRPGKQKTRTAEFLDRNNQVIDWHPMVDIIRVLDRSGTNKGGRPRHDILVIVELMFLLNFYELSEPQLEELFNDHLSFRFRVTSYQQFVGLSMADKAADFTSFLIFKRIFTPANQHDSNYTRN